MPSILNYYYHIACRHVKNKCWKLQHNRLNTFRVKRFWSSLVAKNALFEKKIPEDQWVKIVPITQFHTDISTQNDSICYRGNKNSHFLMGFFDCSWASGMSSSELLENWSGWTSLNFPVPYEVPSIDFLSSYARSCYPYLLPDSVFFDAGMTSAVHCWSFSGLFMPFRSQNVWSAFLQQPLCELDKLFVSVHPRKMAGI